MRPFDILEQIPPDPIFGLSRQFKEDPRKNKYTFVTGYFRKEDLVTPVLNSVAQAEKELASARNCREYLPIKGMDGFTNRIGELVFGPFWDPKAFCSFQTVGGTGALYAIGSLAAKWTDQIAIPKQTWVNHFHLFAQSGLKTTTYPYYGNKELLVDQTLEQISKSPRGSCLLLHTNCHNPTGLDLSPKVWKQILSIVKEKELFPILDMAYQGFGGTLEEDAFTPQLFAKAGLPFALTYTCAKNFSIYSERAGALFVYSSSAKEKERIEGNVKRVIRGIYSNPPFHGAKVVEMVLSSKEKKELWIEELFQMRQRISKVRKDFSKALAQRDPQGGWEMIEKGKGLFCLSGLEKSAIEKLRLEKGLYLTADGRINLTGLNANNLDFVADAIINS